MPMLVKSTSEVLKGASYLLYLQPPISKKRSEVYFFLKENTYNRILKINILEGK